MKTTKSIVITLLTLIPLLGLAQDKEATLTLRFATEDSIKTAIILVEDAGAPAAEVEVKLFAERLGGLLPLGDATTDESGEARIEFPLDLPGDDQHIIHVIAKVEENDVFMDTEVSEDIAWGTAPNMDIVKPLERSLSAGRARAPIYFILASVLIIIGIWGTLCYIVYQLFRMRKLGTVNDQNYL